MTPTATAFFSRSTERAALGDEESFWRSLRVRNQTTKQTRGGRLLELDIGLLQHLERTGAKIRNILDIGISTGVTTFELHNRLVAAGHAVRTVGTDLHLNAAILRLTPRCAVLVDSAGDVLQYEVFGRAVRPWCSRRDYLTGMVWVRAALKRKLMPSVQRAFAQESAIVRRVALVSPSVLHSPGIAIVEDDIFVDNSSFAGKFDFIRAANILGLNYFAPDILQNSLARLTSYLAGPGALLLVARTSDRGSHDATLFRMEPSRRLSVAARYGRGSEVEHLVLTDPLGGK